MSLLLCNFFPHTPSYLFTLFILEDGGVSASASMPVANVAAVPAAAELSDPSAAASDVHKEAEELDDDYDAELNSADGGEYSLAQVFNVEDLNKPQPEMCNNCELVACSTWNSNGTSKSVCYDCQLG